MFYSTLFCCLCAFFTFSCHDFKSWESVFSDRVVVAFEPESDPVAPNCPKSLISVKVGNLPMHLYHLTSNSSVQTITLKGNPTWAVHLPFDKNHASFLIKNEGHYHRITIFYKRIASLISTEAGGLQQQYIIKKLILTPQKGKRSLFKSYKIQQKTLLKEDKITTPHIILYY